MQIQTTRFGEIDIDESKIIAFGEGLMGFEHLKRFTLITSEDTWPFQWMQALDDPDIALCSIVPIQLFPDYSPHVPHSVFDDLAIVNDDDVALYTAAVIPQDFVKMTTNLAAPIIINTANNRGIQIILDSRDYELRRPIFNEVQALLSAGGQV